MAEDTAAIEKAAYEEKRKTTRETISNNLSPLVDLMADISSFAEYKAYVEAYNRQSTDGTKIAFDGNSAKSHLFLKGSKLFTLNAAMMEQFKKITGIGG